MSNRIIELSVNDAFINKSGETIGASGSAYALTLRMTFDGAWDGTTKTVFFKDANGENSVSVVIGLDALVTGTQSTYDVQVPSEPLAVPGMAVMTVRGVILNGDTVTRAITTRAATFSVMDADLPGSAGTPGTITSSDKEQLQSEIDALESLFTTNAQLASSAAASASDSATAAAASASVAYTSAQSASGSASGATASAATASAKADVATTAAGNASASASAASASEANAAASATTATNKAAEAVSAANTATTRASEASASALNAAASEAIAAASASTATAKAGEATDSASDAARSATAAAQSETAAASSAAAAADSAAEAAEIVGGDFLTKSGDGSDVTVAFAEAIERLPLTTGDKLSALFGKIEKWLSSLGTAAFTDSTAYDASGTATGAVTAHNSAAGAHSDLFNGKAAASHAAQHKTGGTDPIVPADIGAASGSIKTATLTAAGWSGLAQTVAVAGVTATNRVDVAAAPASATAYAKAKVLCTAQAAGSLTFTCGKAPTADLIVNIGILNL